MPSSHRIYAWRGRQMTGLDTGPKPDVAYGLLEDSFQSSPEWIRVGRWDGLRVVEISDPIAWADRPAVLA